MALRTQGRKAWEGAWCVLPEMYWTPLGGGLTPLIGAGLQGPQRQSGHQPLGDPAERLPPGKSDKRTSPPPAFSTSVRPGVPRDAGPSSGRAGLASRRRGGPGGSAGAGGS